MAMAGGLQSAKAFHGFVSSCEVGSDSSKINLSILAFVDNQDHLFRMDLILSNDLHPMSCCTHAFCSWSCLPPCLPSCTLYPSWSGMLRPRSWAPHYLFPTLSPILFCSRDSVSWALLSLVSRLVFQLVFSILLPAGSGMLWPIPWAPSFLCLLLPGISLDPLLQSAGGETCSSRMPQHWKLAGE